MVERNLPLLFLGALVFGPALLPSQVLADSLHYWNGRDLGEDTWLADYDMAGIVRRDDEDLIYLQPRGVNDNKCDDEEVCSLNKNDIEIDDFPIDDELLDDVGIAVRRGDLNMTDPENMLVGELKAVLEARDPGQKKTTPTCKGLGVSGLNANGFKIAPWKHPGTSDEPVKDNNLYYDFEFNGRDDGRKEGYYNLKNIKKRSTDHEIATEHIVEWQLLDMFIEADKSKGDKSRCAHMLTYYDGPEVTITTDLNVKKQSVIKEERKTLDDQKKAKSDDFEKLKITKLKMKPNDYLAKQFPGWETGKETASQKLSTAFAYEFVSLHQGVNLQKAILFRGQKLSPEVKGSGELGSDGDLSNSFTMEWRLKNRYRKGADDKKVYTYKQNQGFLLALDMYKENLGLWVYLKTPKIQEYFASQANRIGAAFDYLEKHALPNSGIQGFKAMSPAMGDDWRDWIKKKWTTELARLEKWLDDYAEKIKKEAKVAGLSNLTPTSPNTIGKRDVIFTLSKRGTKRKKKLPPGEDSCPKEKDSGELKKRVNRLMDLYDKKGTMPNPFS